MTFETLGTWIRWMRRQQGVKNEVDVDGAEQSYGPPGPPAHRGE